MPARRPPGGGMQVMTGGSGGRARAHAPAGGAHPARAGAAVDDRAVQHRHPFPAFASMGDELSTSAAGELQLVVTAYMLAFAAMSLFHGPLSDASVASR